MIEATPTSLAAAVSDLPAVNQARQGSQQEHKTGGGFC